MKPAKAHAEAPVKAPLMAVRRLVRSSMSYRHAAALSEGFAASVPRPLQRLAEQVFDFPISQVVRAAPILLIRVPKSASASLSLQVYGRVLTHAPHRTALFYKQSDPAFFATTTSLAVVRNPWTRLQSAYTWLKMGGTALAGPNAQTCLEMSAISSFPQFVLEYVLPAFRSGRLRRLDPTLHEQCDFVCDERGEVIVDRVFKLDEMEAVQQFLVEHGVLRRERRVNEGAALNVDAMPAVSDEIDDAIRQIYERDIARFGFRRDSLTRSG